MPKSLAELQQIALFVRRAIVEITGAAGSGHLDGSLSAVEILVELFLDYMRIDPQNPEWPNRHGFIPSLGSIDQRASRRTLSADPEGLHGFTRGRACACVGHRSCESCLTRSRDNQAPAHVHRS